MKTPNWGLALGLLLCSTATFAQDVIISTVIIDTGSCAPATSTGGLFSNGGAGGGPSTAGILGGDNVDGAAGNGAGVPGPLTTTDEAGAVTVISPTTAPPMTSIVGSSATGAPLPSGVKTSVDSNSNSGTYTFNGFYASPATGALLDGRTTTDLNMSRISNYMTLESCAYFCQTEPYFSVEEGYVCRCGTVAPSSTPVDSPLSLQYCTGDKAEICGGAGFGVVYRGSPAPSSTRPISAPPWTSTIPDVSVAAANQGSTTTNLADTVVQTTAAVSSGPDQASGIVIPVGTTNIMKSSLTSTNTAITSALNENAESTTPSAAGPLATISPPEIPVPVLPSTVVPISSTTPADVPPVVGPSSSAAVVVLPTTPADASSPAAPGISSSVVPAVISSTAAVVPLASSSSPAPQVPVTSAAAPPTTTVEEETGPAEPTLIAVPTCPPTGPSANNTRYVDLFDNTYDIRCGLSFVGTQSTTAHADTFLRCLQYCDLLNGCVGVTFVDYINQFNNNTNCNSYYSFQGYTAVTETFEGDFYNGRNIHGASHGVVDPSTGENTNEDLCAEPVTERYGPDVYGACYQIGCDQTIGQRANGVPLAPTVLSSLLGCSLYCSFYNDCVSVTFTGRFVAGQETTNCFPKSSYNTTVATAEVGTSFAFNGKCPGV